MKTGYREVFESSRTVECPRGTVFPPNRLASRNWDLLAVLPHAGSATALETLRQTLATLLGRNRVMLAPSARCAIAQLVALLPQQEVVMPAFNCGVVKSAVEATGKRIIYVDVAKGSVNATAAEFARAAQPGRILLATHQFGVPTDIEAICELARSRDCVTIEDAACSFGSIRNGRHLGTFADFGVFSFESWKRIPAFRGGAIVVNDERHLSLARLKAEPLVKAHRKMPTREIVSAAARNLATIPWLYGRFVLPRLLRGYGQIPRGPVATPAGNVTKGAAFTRAFHPYQAQLVLRLLGRRDEIRDHIARLVSVYANAFQDGAVTTFLPARRDDAGVLRFPIAFPGRKRADVLRSALKRGLYLETEFEEPLPDPSEYSQFPNAVWTGHNLVLLPLYPALRLEDAGWIAAQVKAIAHEGSG